LRSALSGKAGCAEGGMTDPIVWVVGAQGDGKLYGFRGADGKPLAAVAGGGPPIQLFQTILSANGRFYVAAAGAVYAFVYQGLRR
jgi:hypothetical protein